MTKKVLSIALALMLAFSTLSLSVSAADEKKEEKKAEISLFEQYNPNVAKAFANASKANSGDSALTQKQKEFITLGIAIAVKCEACTKTHAKRAVEAGATMQELAEVVGVNVMMGGGPATAFGKLALETAKAAGAKESEKKIDLKPITEIEMEVNPEDLMTVHKLDFAKKYSLIGENVMRDGYLTVKEKELVSLAIAVAVGCEGCMNYHGAQCAKVGVTEAELMDMVACNRIMEGGPSSPASRVAIKAYKDAKAAIEKEDKEAKTETKTETKTK